MPASVPKPRRAPLVPPYARAPAHNPRTAQTGAIGQRRASPAPQGAQAAAQRRAVAPVAAEPSPVQVAHNYFRGADLPTSLRQQVDAHLSTLDENSVAAYGRNLHILTAQPGSRSYPLPLDHALLEAIVAQHGIDHVTLVSMGVQLALPEDGPRQRLALFEAMARWPKPVLALRPLVIDMLRKLPNPDVRLRIATALPSWQCTYGAVLEAYLQALEPLWPVLTAVADVDALDKHVAASKSDTGPDRDGLTADDEMLPAFALHETECMDDDELNQLLRQQANRADRIDWRDWKSNDHESVMRAARHFATHAAARTVIEQTKRRVPYAAVIQIIDVLLGKLENDLALREVYNINPFLMKRAMRTWDRPWRKNENIGPLTGSSILFYLGDHKMPINQFTALIWQAIQSFVEPEKSWAQSFKSRLCMTTSFIKALGRLQMQTKAEEKNSRA